MLNLLYEWLLEQQPNLLAYTDIILVLCCSYGDISIYLLHTTNFVTLEEVKNFKSLQSYGYFTSGWVLEHKWKTFNEVSLIIGKVNHSYSVSSPPLQPWVIVKQNGAVSCGHSTCMASHGETCSHIGALLYWVEYTVRRRDETSCSYITHQLLDGTSNC